jgi:hypothetical protein
LRHKLIKTKYHENELPNKNRKEPKG